MVRTQEHFFIILWFSRFFLASCCKLDSLLNVEWNLRTEVCFVPLEPKT